MREFVNTPLFGIVLTILAFEFGKLALNKTKFPLFNPILIAIIIIISSLMIFDISLETYNKGGSFILFFLGPATVALAIPIYKQSELLKQHFLPIIIGIIVGSITCIISVILISKLLNLDMKLLLSFVPKSITTPIGIELSKSLGGIPSITIGSILLTGIVGNITAPFICKVFKIKNDISKGVAIGTSSHAIGTSKAMEMSDVVGAMSGLSIGIAGIITILVAPFIVKLLA